MNNLQRSAQTKASILDAATVCFAREGFDATGVAEICQRAGVSKGAFYYHFESKEAAFLELIASWLSALEQVLEDEAYNYKTVPEGLLGMAGNIQQIVANNRMLMSLFLELWTHASRNEKIHQATIAPYKRYLLIFEKLVQRGIDEGSFETVDPASAGQLLLSLSSGFFLQASLDPDGANWGKLLQESIHILLNGLKRRN
ncbi:MAG TPA: TetR/AcrR family transcriptional regulator [Candidatus Limnocylindrales bacterium]|nr:TetR/AcrR family transcriptional regulator [Candidatus Limnocylindrales bacterium]